MTAGDASIAIGGTVTDPTVSVADLGITSAEIADGNVTEAKLSFDPATQVELDAAIAGAGDITAVLAGIGLVGGAFSGDASLELSPSARVRGITYLAGCDTCDVLVDADDQPGFYFNVIGSMTFNSISCFSDAGTPTINMQRDDGTPANILSSNLACSTSGATSMSFDPGEDMLNLNDKLNFSLVAAGGVARRITVVIKATIN